jgi:3-methyl-2-oxobutanoate hydroxymethyltransferase
MSRKKTTVHTLQKLKDDHVPITMITAYDYSSAMLADRAGMDLILVGDSLAMVMLGRDSTVSVTMEEILHHCRAVAQGAQSAFLVGDMPFMSYQPSIPEAIRNAGRFLKEAGMDAVKLEGGHEVADTIRAIVDAGVPVMGHIGLTPQTVSQLGGFRVQGKTAVSAQTMLGEALALEKAGCFAIVLEAVPASVATAISKRLTIPTIGIGAGAGCDGQVLVYHDMLGLFDKFVPKFVKQYAHVGDIILEALETYRDEVKNGTFPAPEHTYPMEQTEEETFLKALNGSI